SDPEKGSGAVKITPAHDFNDFEVGRRHGLPLVNVLDQEARITLDLDAIGDSAGDDLNDLLSLNGLDRFVARQKVVAMMEARGL
ncbi:UNVERIFIED_CONTAM: class I tRNA ligase family protein, partial [Bacteroidetes bacterium 56_B9]